MPDNDMGALAAALATAQASFPTIPRDKEVTVKSEKGSYKFKYAPLDSILNATRKPLAENGLAVAQLLDSDADGGPALVTMLLHSGGGSLTARTPIPFSDGAKVQVFGSAITYLRRYALQALLGIAAEDDDDGNAADGNQATFGAAPERRDGSLIGTAVKEKKATTDFLPRESPEGHFIGFRLKDGLGSVICEIRGPLALMVAAHEDEIIDKRVQVQGSFVQYEPPTVTHAYRAFRVTRLQAGELILPVEGAAGQPSEAEAAGVDAPGATPAPNLSPAEQAELDAIPLFAEDPAA